MQTAEQEGEMKFSLPYGEARIMTCDERFDIETPVADIRATGALDFVIWESVVDGKKASCLAVLKGVVEIKNIADPEEDFIRVPQLRMSCVAVGGVPSKPVDIPDALLKELREKGNWGFIESACSYECGECEKLNHNDLTCIPDNHKLCDDGDACTHNDRCQGRICIGQRDPSTTTPGCS